MLKTTTPKKRAGVPTINESFTEEEWSLLKSIKISSGLNWHDFIMEAAQNWKKSINKQDR